MPNDVSNGLSAVLEKYRSYVNLDYIQEQRAKYVNEGYFIGPVVHNRVTAQALKWFRMGVNRGASEEELRRLITYFVICTDAMKYKIDYRRARTDLNIMDIVVKYCMLDGR